MNPIATISITLFLCGLIFGVGLGITIGLGWATKVLGIPKGYKVDKVTYKKIDSEPK